MSQLDEGVASPGRGWGGRRSGAGRKPRGGFAALKGDLAYAKHLISKVMRDESQPMGLRTRCALAVARGDAVRNVRPPANVEEISPSGDGPGLAPDDEGDV